MTMHLLKFEIENTSFIPLSDRASTVQNGCRLRIMAFGRAITEKFDTSDTGCRLRLYGRR